MAGKNVPVTDIKPGDIIDYNGARAMVFRAWASQDEAPIRDAPVGLEITWVSPADGQSHNTRLVWPDLPARSPDAPRPTDAELADALKSDIKRRPVKRLYAWG